MSEPGGTKESSGGWTTDGLHGSTTLTVRTFDPATVDCVPTEVAYAIGDTVGVDSSDVGPIYEAVNCDVLDRLFQGDVADQSFTFSFEYEDLVISVSDGGRIAVQH